MKRKVQSNAPNQIFKNFYSFTFILFNLLLVFNLNSVSAQNGNANENATVDGGEISTTDDTTVCVGDGVADYIDVTLEGASGRVKQWIITDDENNILALPESPPFDFDGAPPGNCRIWHLSYNGIKPLVDPSGQGKFTKNLADIRGKFDLSNYIEVERIQQPKGGDLAIEGGATEIEICAGDGVSDAFNVTLDGAEGPYMQWVITDPDGNILGLPDGPPFDLEGAGEGTCLIWNLSYAENVSLDGVTNANQLTGCFDLSNPITVTRNGVDGGVLEIAGGGTEIEICAGDGVSDAFDVTVTGVQPGPTAWVITDSDGKILGLPAGPPFDLEGAGEGTCLIWHLSYEEGLEGAAVDNNAADLVGCYDLSNPITVIRNGVNGGDLAIEGGATEIEICAGDGVSDAFNVTLENNIGDYSQWVITDSDGNILALPPGPPFDLEGAGEGTCLIWNLSYASGLSGADIGNNAADLVGCYNLSNPITVTRNGINGGDLAIEGGATEIEICAGDGVSDAFNVTLENALGDNSLWVITDTDANILATPDGPPFDLEGAGEGTCLIWHLSYEDTVSLEGVTNASQLEGCYSLSNPITVTRNGVNGGVLVRTDGIDEPFAFTVGDGTDDFIPADAITLTENIGSNSQWVITDDTGVILGLPSSPYEVNFDGAEVGTCLVWHLSYEDGLEGAAEGNNAADLVGCYSLSNSLSVVRTAASGRIALYPNPTKGKVNIGLSNFGSKDVSIRISNLQNIQMFSKELYLRTISRTQSTSIDVSNYQNGIYFVSVTDNVSGKSYVKRLIVE